MAKWAGIFLLVMIAAAVLGFVVDAVRVIAGFLFVACAVGLVVSLLAKKKS
ncbi:MAG: hypothetical protein ACK41C_07370 [Phenylobacterium sp.]|jgi:uncharacterized membrane protein YtjA (UPF0391 family)|uniref:hypothetical protein n=1 Tax=Phenylobacterium sp. TaxID=1871053 RepID=UPI00391CAFCE